MKKISPSGSFTFLIIRIIFAFYLLSIQAFAQNLPSGGYTDQSRPSQNVLSQGQEKALEANSYLFFIKRILENEKKQKDSILGKKIGLQPQAYNILKQTAINCYNTIQPIDYKAQELIKRFQSEIGTNKLTRGSKLSPPPVELKTLQEEKNNRLIQCRDIIRNEIGEMEFGKVVQYTNQIRSKMLNKTSLPSRNTRSGFLSSDVDADVRYSNISFRETPMSASSSTQTTYNVPGVYTYSSIDFDDNTNTTEGYSSMQMDYEVAAYYHPKVTATLKDDVGNGLATGQFTGTGTSADVSLTAPDQTAQCEDFIIETVFELILIYVSYTSYYYEWYDPYNYYGFSVNPASYDPYFGFSETRVIRWEAILIWVATEVIRPIACENPPEAPPTRINIKTPNKTGFIQNTTQKAMLGATIPFDTALVGVTDGGTYEWKLDGNVVGGNSKILDQSITSLGTHNISVRYTKGAVNITASVTINVITPQLDSQNGGVYLKGRQTVPELLSHDGCNQGLWHLTTGCESDAFSQGIQITARVDESRDIISNRNESFLKIVQIADSELKVFVTQQQCKKLTKRNTANPWMLDSADPYGYPTQSAVGTLDFAPRDPNKEDGNIYMTDTPKLKLGTVFAAYLDDKFESYLVYFTGTITNPQNQKAIAVLPWSWKHAARNTATGGAFPAYVEFPPPTFQKYPADNSNGYIDIVGQNLTPTDSGTGIRSYDPTPIQTFVDPALADFQHPNWVSCP